METKWAPPWTTYCIKFGTKRLLYWFQPLDVGFPSCQSEVNYSMWVFHLASWSLDGILLAISSSQWHYPAGKWAFQPKLARKWIEVRLVETMENKRRSETCVFLGSPRDWCFSWERTVRKFTIHFLPIWGQSGQVGGLCVPIIKTRGARPEDFSRLNVDREISRASH